jgi:hypothetical protein
MSTKSEIVRRMIGSNTWHDIGDTCKLYAACFTLTVLRGFGEWIAHAEDPNCQRRTTRHRASVGEAKIAAVEMLEDRIDLGEGRELTPWIAEEHCAMRVLRGKDPAVIANRVAFIEKTPRVRIAHADEPWSYSNDSSKWWQGPKGSGGSGNAEREQTYGFDPESRAWCDEQLVALGYVLETEQ